MFNFKPETFLLLLARILTIISGNRFEIFKDETLTCSKSSVYTKIDKKCDGWSKTSLESCKQKCSNNTLPGSCTNNNEICQYIVWNSNVRWCHLANQNCTKSAVWNNDLKTYKLIGKLEAWQIKS